MPRRYLISKKSNTPRCPPPLKRIVRRCNTKLTNMWSRWWEQKKPGCAGQNALTEGGSCRKRRSSADANSRSSRNETLTKSCHQIVNNQRSNIWSLELEKYPHAKEPELKTVRQSLDEQIVSNEKVVAVLSDAKMKHDQERRLKQSALNNCNKRIWNWTDWNGPWNQLAQSIRRRRIVSLIRRPNYSTRRANLPACR